MSLYTKNRWVINVMGSPINVGGQYPFITFFTLPMLSGKFLLWCDEGGAACEKGLWFESSLSVFHSLCRIHSFRISVAGGLPT